MLSIKHLFPFLLVVVSQWVNAQAPVANFNASPASGCAPLIVNFKDASSGNPSSWNWDFGNGQLSNIQNPVVAFSQPGVYNVKLVVKNANGTHGITKDSLIVVYPSPQADFSANITTGCNPVNVQFSDLSTSTAGAITTWDWDFGDGTKSNQKNPQKTYNVNGFYTVSLTVTSSTGCKSSTSRSRYIRIVSGTKADFTNTTNGDCRPPFTANFSNQSAGPGSMTFAWDLGNGTTSTQRNPNTVYNAAGTYTVTLTATSDFGCSNTITKSVLIRSSSTVIGGPDSICVNKPLNFVNSSSPAPVSSVWTFDDGTQSFAPNPSKTYSTVGRHVVKLVNTYAYCKDSITKTIHVLDPPTVDFTSSTILACKPPLTVNFTDASPTQAVAWAWDFGDGGKSTQQNPTHIYNSAGQFDVSLTVTNSSGCTNTLVKNVFVKIVPPALNILGVRQGCAPFTFTPVADVRAVDGVASYSWDFGDGPGSVRIGASPSYTYNTPGNYTVKLTITTIGGCTETLSSSVKVGTRVVVDFSVDKVSGCAPDSFRFTNLTTQGTEWFWEFGDGTTDTTKNPAHAFWAIGQVSVKLTALNNGCASDKTDFVTVRAPLARFDDTVLNCADKYTVQFIDKSRIVAANNPVYEWTFPNSVKSSFREPVMTFPGPGTYFVSLKVSDPVTGCSETVAMNVPLTYETAKFTASKVSLCKNQPIRFSAGGDSTKIVNYQWRLGNGAFFQGPRHLDTSFDADGIHDVALVITNGYGGCTDTLVTRAMITIIGPDAGFKNDSGACQSKAVTFTDTSTTTRRITKWTWDFGDGAIQSFTTAVPFTHTYKDTGTYSVKLTVQDDVGCTHTAAKTNALSITNPLINFDATDTIYCQGAALQFRNLSQGKSLKYSWDFGDGGTSNLADPTHAYTGSDSTYTVKLKITDASGCEDSLTRSGYVDIRRPKAAFTAVDTASICPPLETKFTLLGKDYETIWWDFGDASGSTLKDPTHFYNTNGTFNVTLYLTGYGGCVDSSSSRVNVYNPAALTSLNYTPLDACNSLNVDFSITTPPQTKFVFYYGDGLTDSSQQKTFKHFYSSPNFYQPFLNLSDDVGCQAVISGAQTIKVLGAVPNFSRDRREFCDSGSVFFTNYTIGNDPITSSVWNFDDGTTSRDTDPIHYFGRPDQYAVSLNVTTQAGCSSSLVDTIRVYRTPDPIITSINPACLNTPILFSGSLAVADTAITYKWDLGNGQNSSLTDVTSVYGKTGKYRISLEAANRLGCKKTASKDLDVAPLPVITMGPNPVIPVGTGIDLPVTYGNRMRQYTWMPAKDLSCANCAVPFANPKFTTQYKVTVTDSNNCVSSSEVTVRVVCNNKNYFLPNTFTPNGDGANDVFYPRGSSIDRIQSLRVFNRWGQVVFEKRNITANSTADGWNGMFQGRPANPDTYIYTIEFVCENGEIVNYKGNVTLLR